MLLFVVVVLHEPRNSINAVLYPAVVLDVDVVVLDCPPESFDVDVVVSPTLAIHTELCFQVAIFIPFLKQTHERVGCVLTALIRVENFGSSVLLHGFLHGFDAEVR